MSIDSFGTSGELRVGGTAYRIHRLARIAGADRLPYSLKVLLENLVRNEDGRLVTAEQIDAMKSWRPDAVPEREIHFTPARVLMQDFTGVPGVVDLVAMRDGLLRLGGDPRRVNPLIPTDLVIDHSVIVDVFGKAGAFAANARLEFERNAERYGLLRWAQRSFANFRVVPPDNGICHQVNLEYMAQVVCARQGRDAMLAFPDTLVGTDSHTPMVNGLGILGWGVGGIEAEAAMLGQPLSMLIPEVVGLKLTGELPAGTTATDLVLTIAELLRHTGVVGKFVEFYGPGVGNIPVATRATLGNMSPEYGATCAIFPIDDQTLSYLRLTGRSEHQVRLVETYAKEQGLWHEPTRHLPYSRTIELELGAVEPSIAGPKRPQDRIPLRMAPRAVGALLLGRPQSEVVLDDLDRAGAASFPASDPIAGAAGSDTETFHIPTGSIESWPSNPVIVSFADGTRATLDHGHVVIAAITSCTNTSNPHVMIGAALLARNAVKRGLTRKPWVKTSLAPGSRVVTDYLERAGLTPYLDSLGFNLVGYGCTTCIGNSGPLIPEVAAAVEERDLTVCSVLSGNRNFEGRIHAQCRMNFLASPPLVVAYALTGTLLADLVHEPLGKDEQGHPVYLRNIWPSSGEIQSVIDSSLRADLFAKDYADIFAGNDSWRGLPVPDAEAFEWDPGSTYVRHPPYLDGVSRDPAPLNDICGARVLVMLGDSVTTDHISPAGAIAPASPAGAYLSAQGIARKDFNSYGSRRGNHEIMIRGTFANIRLRNLLAPETVGGFTRDFSQPGAPVTTIYDASRHYLAAGTPLLILAGKEYGTGSSRDWAAKGTALLGVRAVIADSYERIHRSNLIGMGVLPLQFRPGESATTLGLTGEETFEIQGLGGNGELPDTLHIRTKSAQGLIRAFDVNVRVDTPIEGAYYRHGGILPYMLRQLLRE